MNVAHPLITLRRIILAVAGLIVLILPALCPVTEVTFLHGIILGTLVAHPILEACWSGLVSSRRPFERMPKADGLLFLAGMFGNGCFFAQFSAGGVAELPSILVAIAITAMSMGAVWTVVQIAIIPLIRLGGWCIDQTSELQGSEQPLQFHLKQLMLATFLIAAIFGLGRLVPWHAFTHNESNLPIALLLLLWYAAITLLLPIGVVAASLLKYELTRSRWHAAALILLVVGIDILLELFALSGETHFFLPTFHLTEGCWAIVVASVWRWDGYRLFREKTG